MSKPQVMTPSEVTTNSEVVIWDKNDKESLSKVSEVYKEFLGECGAVQYAKSSWDRQDFRNIDTNTNAKSPFTRSDYDYYRPEEAIPEKIANIIKACDMAYQRVGIVRNVIDLMGDFACQGITIVHPNPGIQEFYRAWFKKINGRDRSERFLNQLYRLGNVVVSRELGQVRKSDLEKIKKGRAAKTEFVDLKPENPPLRNELPLSYTFMNVCNIEVIHSELASFVGQEPRLALKVSNKLKNTITNPKTPEEKELVSKLPQDLVKQLKKSNQKYILLDPNLVSAYFYKKDDWRDWAMPMLYSILDNLVTLEKMRLTDLSALDGAISRVRLWTLGDATKGIAPTKAAAVRLSNQLTNNSGGGTLDLIWTEDLKLQVSDTNVHQFLGETKYAPVWQAIFQGLGIPATLAGAPNASGTTNNFIAMKTLVERLEYGRSVLKSFWEKELKHVQQACGFRFPAEIHFERMSLSDEVAEKALLIQLADRDIISYETMQQMVGLIPNLERIRTRKENEERKAGRRVPKASQWHNPEKDHEYKKIALQGGIVTTSQIGLELEPNKRGEVAVQDQQMKLQEEQMQLDHELKVKQQELDMELQRDQHEYDKILQKKKMLDDQKIKRSKMKNTNKGTPGQGRPKNSKDSKKRKRTVKPRTSAGLTSAQLQVWAADAQNKITDIVVPLYLTDLGKKNLRQLTAKEFDDLEYYKFAILCSFEPTDALDDNSIKALYGKVLEVPKTVYVNYKKLVAKVKNPTVANLRQLQIVSYVRFQKENKRG